MTATTPLRWLGALPATVTAVLLASPATAFDVTRPESASLLTVVPLSLTKDATNGPHIAPEGLCFVPADRSPLGEPLLAVACEVTGTTVLFRVTPVALD